MTHIAGKRWPKKLRQQYKWIPRPDLSHLAYPYLLPGLTIDRPNQVWAMDITYIPTARCFVYLTAVVDWYSRRVLVWRVPITMDVHSCIEAVEEAKAAFQSGAKDARSGIFLSAAINPDCINDRHGIHL